MFLDLASLDTAAVAAVVAITVLAVGGVKSLYAVAAARVARTCGRPRHGQAVQTATGCGLIRAGGYLIYKS